MEVAMVYVNNLTEASKAHLYNIHPLSEIAFYSSSKNVIDFLELFTNKSEKVTHSLSKLRSLTMKGCKLKAYYQQFTKLLADIGWDHSSTEAVRFFVEGLNPDALPTNLKLAVSDYTTYPGITVMQLFTYADRKLSLAHGENYSNVSTSNTKTTTNGDSSGSKKSVKSNGGGVQNNKNKKSPSNTNKQQSSNKKQKTARVEYDECERCGRKHLGLCNAWRHKDGTPLAVPLLLLLKQILRNLREVTKALRSSPTQRTTRQRLLSTTCQFSRSPVSLMTLWNLSMVHQRSPYHQCLLLHKVWLL